MAKERTLACGRSSGVVRASFCRYSSPRFHSGLHDPLGGHLHPLKYSLGLARAASELGVRIHEGSVVLSMEPGASVTLRTARGSGSP